MRLNKCRMTTYGCWLIAALLFGVQPAMGQEICGDNIVNNAEECDGTDDAACPGLCIPPGIPNECTCMLDCDDADVETADGFHEVTSTAIWGWIPNVTLPSLYSFHFHVESVTWTSLEKWLEFTAGTDSTLRVNIKATINGQQIDHLLEDFRLLAGESVEFHGLIETATIENVWVWVTNIGEEPANFDFHLHWEFAGGPSGLSDACWNLPIGPVDPPIIPAVSEWGMMVLTLLVMTAATVVLARRRRAAVA